MIIQLSFIVRNLSKRYIQYHKKERSGYIEKCSPRILEVYFPAGAKYIFNIGENENSICEMWNSVSHGSDAFWRLNVFYLTLLDKFLQVFYFILFLITNTPYNSRSPTISISCRFYLDVTVRWMFCCSLESQENGKRLSELECTLSPRLLFHKTNKIFT